MGDDTVRLSDVGPTRGATVNPRIVSAGFHMSLDGFIARPGGELDWLDFGSDVVDHAIETMRGIDTMLLGRRAFIEQAAHWPQQTGPLADAVNSHDKVVVTGRPERVDLRSWSRSRTAADPAVEIERLQCLPGLRIGVGGGAHTFRTLLERDLIDEIRVITHPVTLGHGVTPWPEGLRLKLGSTHHFGSGAILHTYVRST